jgi:hypothetical protein
MKPAYKKCLYSITVKFAFELFQKGLTIFVEKRQLFSVRHPDDRRVITAFNDRDGIGID